MKADDRESETSTGQSPALGPWAGVRTRCCAGEKPLNILGLGSSVGTGANGMRSVVVVGSFDELESWENERVKERSFFTTFLGTDRRNEHLSHIRHIQGRAIGRGRSIVRSMTGSRPVHAAHRESKLRRRLTRTFHARVTVEEAAWIRRMVEAGQDVRLIYRNKRANVRMADSANVMAEITGRELAGRSCSLGGHIDSWDVGQGAHDNGAACRRLAGGHIDEAPWPSGASNHPRYSCVDE